LRSSINKDYVRKVLEMVQKVAGVEVKPSTQSMESFLTLLTLCDVYSLLIGDTLLNLLERGISNPLIMFGRLKGFKFTKPRDAYILLSYDYPIKHVFIYVPYKVWEVGTELTARGRRAFTLAPLDFCNFEQCVKELRASSPNLTMYVEKFFEKYPQLLDLLASVGTAWEVEDKNPIVVLVPYKGIPEKDIDWLILGIDRALRTAELLHKRPEIVRLVQSLGEKLLKYYTSRNITSIEINGPTILFKSGDTIEESLDSLVRSVQSMLFQRLMREYRGED